jgi:DNA-binding NarL/FixJ family response regulator
MTSVVIVDDHPIVRAGIRAVLSRASDITILAEGKSGAEALRLVAEHRPDVLILDVNLPDTNGVLVTRQLCAEGASTAILVLTVHDDEETVFGLFDSGAAGYVLKDDALETMASAVRAVAGGQAWLSPGIATRMMQRAGAPRPATAAADSLPLTARERQVLCLLAQGFDNASIAQQLVVTPRTIQNCVSTIYSKLGVASRTEAALMAIRQGLVSPPGKP